MNRRKLLKLIPLALIAPVAVAKAIAKETSHTLRFPNGSIVEFGDEYRTYRGVRFHTLNADNLEMYASCVGKTHRYRDFKKPQK